MISTTPSFIGGTSTFVRSSSSLFSEALKQESCLMFCYSNRSYEWSSVKVKKSESVFSNLVPSFDPVIIFRPSRLCWRVKLWLPPWGCECCSITIGKSSTLWLSKCPIGDIVRYFVTIFLPSVFYSSLGKDNSSSSTLSGPIIELCGGLLLCFKNSRLFYCFRWAVSKWSSTVLGLLRSVTG